MSTPNQLFRQAALDRLASPEQLDQLMQVTTPKSRLALWACGGLLLLAVLWSILGVIPSKVAGPGILINQGGVFVTTARSEGSVLEILVEEGTPVSSNQVLARLWLPELELRLRQAEIARDRLEDDLERLIQNQAQEAKTEQEAQDKQVQTYHAMKRDFLEQIGALKARLTNLTELLSRKSPAVSKVQLLETTNSLFLAQHDLARTEIQLKQIGLNQLQGAERRRQQLSEKEAELLAARQNVEYLTQLYGLNSEIRSPCDGTVLEIIVKAGQLTSANTPIMTLERAQKRLEARLFLAPEAGKRVLPGMDVALEPVSVKKELFGLMRGTVSSVSPFPARPDAMLRILENPSLVSEFSQHGAPIGVVVQLTTTTNTHSPYVWTSGRGPDVEITSGTLCEGTITVTNHPPIRYVLPLVRR